MQIHSWRIANIGIQLVVLVPSVGAYELRFVLDVEVPEIQKDAPPGQWAELHGASVSFKPNGTSQKKPVGYARPNLPVHLRQISGTYRTTPDFSLQLSGEQITAIEDARDGRSVEWELHFRARGGSDETPAHEIDEKVTISVGHSDWIERLESSGVRGAVLLTVPLPLDNDLAGDWKAIARDLKAAQRHHDAGDHRSCVMACRDVVQGLGFRGSGSKDWHAPLIKRLANNKEDMSLVEREAAILATVRHFTHQAHHGESEGGVTHYTRSDAHLMLTLAAAFVARAQSR